MSIINIIGQIGYSYWLKNNKNTKLTIKDKDTLKRFGISLDKKIFNTSIADKETLFKELSEVYEQERSGNGRNDGMVYTPNWLAEYITKGAFDQWQKIHRGGGKPNSVADISCGTGIFLKEAKDLGEDYSWEFDLYGFDNDKKALEIAEIYSWSTNSQFHLKEIDSLEIGKTLFSDLSQNSKFDIILGNPPYIRSSSLDKNYLTFLRKSYSSAPKGSFDISILFIEKIAELLNEGGIASIILTNKFMTSSYGKLICNYISTQYRVLSIEDFNDLQVFKGYTTYTCIITFAKLKPSKRFLIKKHFEEINASNPKLLKPKIETLEYSNLYKHPWNFASGIEEEIIRICSNLKNPKIMDIFLGVFQGVRTGANDIYIVDKKVSSLFKKKFIKPFINAENINSFELDKTEKFIIFPYIEEKGIIKRIDEIELKSEDQELYNYLNSNKEKLLSRSIQSGAKWFEYSRGQNLSLINKKKILIKEMMPSSQFSCDINLKAVFSAGYAFDCINLNNETILSWSLILSTPVLEFILRHHGTQLHSGWFRIMKHHLKNVRLPNIDKSKMNEIYKIIKNKNLSKNQLISKVNKVVAKSFELNNTHIEYIEKYLSKIHKRSSPREKVITEIIDKYQPVKLEKYNSLHVERDDLRQQVTFTQNKKIPIHNWYKYVQGFSAVLVNTLINELEIKSDHIVLDPFNGCGTTTTVCSYRNIKSIGLEISPLMAEVSRIKTRRWNLDKIRFFIDNISQEKIDKKSFSNKSFVFEDYLSKAYSNPIKDKLIRISNYILSQEDNEIKDLSKIALLSILEDVSLIRKHGSHYRYLNKDTSIGLQKLNINVISENENIFLIFINQLNNLFNDISLTGGNPSKIANIKCLDSKSSKIKSNSIDFVITSPPYLNRNNYIAQQKAELDFLGLIQDKKEYKDLVKSTFRSHTDSNLSSSSNSSISEINTIIQSIELEKGNNPKIPQMICGYFEDLKDSLRKLYKVLKKDGKCVFVVGNTRWGGVVVPVDHILLKIAEELGFSPEKIYVTRLKGNSPQQMKKFGKIPVRESVVIFKK